MAAGGTVNCPMIYRDLDGDGYGDPVRPLSSCSMQTGYVDNNKDCCDADSSAKPGQTVYYVAANGCGNFDYDCDGVATPKVNGPTGCYDAPLVCEYDGEDCVPSTQPPSHCNGDYTDYLQAECGTAWTVSTKGCRHYTCAGPACSCDGFSSGSSQGTQACR